MKHFHHNSKHPAMTAIMLVTFITVLASCVKETLYYTDHPGHGKITLATTWDDRGAGIDIPGSYTVRVGGYSAVLQGTSNELGNLFPPGQYPVHIYNVTDNITVNGVTAAANYAAGTLGWFFTGSHSIAVKKDKDHGITVPMRQQVRQLTLVIEPKGETAGKIESITASLSGVAGTLGLDNGVHGTASNAALNFTKITSGADAGKWFVTVRLLGVTGNRQKLSGRITFTGGSPGNMELESDLTNALANFNADKKTPLALGGEIVNTPSSVATGTMTVNAWQEQGSINGETEY
jgi:hypothetical protein